MAEVDSSLPQNARPDRAHTPGPWHLIVDDPTCLRIHFSLPDGRQSGSAVCIGSTALSFRAPRQGSHRGERMVYRPFADHDRADALLLATAPELLQGARAAWHLCESLLAVREGVPDDGIRRIADFLATAIAKAEGRSPKESL